MSSTLVTQTSWPVVRDEIIGELESVEGIKLIHNRIRWDKKRNSNEERFRKLHTPRGSTTVNSITVSRVAQEREFLSNREYIARTAVSVHFWFELDDDRDTQDDFDQLVDGILLQFQEPIRLDSQVEILHPINLVEEDHRWLAGTLVHHAEFLLTVQERIRQNSFR